MASFATSQGNKSFYHLLGLRAPQDLKDILTSHPHFKNLCTAFIAYRVTPPDVPHANIIPKYGTCQNISPIILSVTHENSRNSHSGARNYNPSIPSYMSDFDPAEDFGSWFFVGPPVGADSSMSVALNTIDFDKINVTGWSLRYGHLFVSFNDRLLKGATVEKNLTLEFDIRIVTSKIRADLYDGYSGNRVMVGAVAHWDETLPRSNKSHFFEVDLLLSQGYAKSYGDPQYELCKDVAYDRCFYSADGKYAEGREISYEKILKQPKLPQNSNEWSHIRIPLATSIRLLNWVSPPHDWSSAYVSGIYIGIEAEGSAHTEIEVKNYEVYAEDP